MDNAEVEIRISIHALREEGDLNCDPNDFWAAIFLSTPSARRATSQQRPLPRFRSYFYPRPPRGGRRVPYRDLIMAQKFLSTPSARRATSIGNYSCYRCAISIHALREEGDLARDNESDR